MNNVDVRVHRKCQRNFISIACDKKAPTNLTAQPAADYFQDFINDKISGWQHTNDYLHQLVQKAL